MDVFTELISLKQGEVDPELEAHAQAGLHGKKHTLSLAAGVRKHMLRRTHADLGRSASRWVRKYRDQKDGWQVERQQRLDAREAAAAHKDQRWTGRARHPHVSKKPLPPVDQLEAMPRFWNSAWGRQSYCNVCTHPASPGRSFQCLFCACAAHFDCVPRAQRPRAQPGVMAHVRYLMAQVRTNSRHSLD